MVQTHFLRHKNHRRTHWKNNFSLWGTAIFFIFATLVAGYFCYNGDEVDGLRQVISNVEVIINSIVIAMFYKIPDAYERLLMDVVRGNQTLFMRRDEVEAAWNWIDPIINKIKKLEIKPTIYEPGSWGPKSSEKLIKKYGFAWHVPDNLKGI